MCACVCVWSFEHIPTLTYSMNQCDQIPGGRCQWNVFTWNTAFNPNRTCSHQCRPIKKKKNLWEWCHFLEQIDFIWLCWTLLMSPAGQMSTHPWASPSSVKNGRNIDLICCFSWSFGGLQPTAQKPWAEERRTFIISFSWLRFHRPDVPRRTDDKPEKEELIVTFHNLQYYNLMIKPGPPAS